MGILQKKKAIIGIVAVAIVIFGCYFFFSLSKPKQAENDPIFSETIQKDKVDTNEEVEKQEPVIMKVDVKGAVQTPGVYMAKPGDRVIDLIIAAGDFTKNANLNKVNLAQLVEDQMVIYIPRVGEEEVDVPVTLSTPVAGTERTGNEGKASSNKKQVNLNTATQAELETLTGIGPSKAIAIIEYRETTGKFQQVEDLKNIPGIGDKTFEKLQDSITVK